MRIGAVAPTRPDPDPTRKLGRVGSGSMAIGSGRVGSESENYRVGSGQPIGSGQYNMHEFLLNILYFYLFYSFILLFIVYFTVLLYYTVLL